MAGSFPAARLREPLSALRRAQLVVVTNPRGRRGRGGSDASAAAARFARARASRAATSPSRHAAPRTAPPARSRTWRGGGCSPSAGSAAPRSFTETAQAPGHARWRASSSSPTITGIPTAISRSSRGGRRSRAPRGSSRPRRTRCASAISRCRGLPLWILSVRILLDDRPGRVGAARSARSPRRARTGAAMIAGAAPAVVVRAPNWLGDTVMAQPGPGRPSRGRAGRPHHRGRPLGLRAARAGRGRRAPGLSAATAGGAVSPGRWPGRGADVALILPNSFEAARAARRWRARRRVGFDTDARGALLTDRGPAARAAPPSGRRVPAARRGARHVRTRGGHPGWRPPCEPRARGRGRGAARRCRIRGRSRAVGLHLGAAGGPAKRWAVAAWAELAERLIHDRLAPVLLGGPGDVAAAAAVLRLAAAGARVAGGPRPAGAAAASPDAAVSAS